MKANEINHAERAHALLSASGASRWLNCTPSAVLESKYPNTTSSFAEEGTVAHELAELKLQLAGLGAPANVPETIADISAAARHRDDCKKAVAAIRDGEYYTVDMDEHTDDYLAYISELYAAAKNSDPHTTIGTEIKVDLTKYIPDGFGTCDAVVISNGTMHVIDLKYGKGLRVSASDNSQLKLYALGAFEAFGFMYDVKTVCLHIFQPRMDNISTYEISLPKLRIWGETEVSAKAALAAEGKGEQVPGDWCTFCKAKAKCTALAAEAMQAAQLDFVQPRELTDEQILDMYKKSARIQSWLSSLDTHVLNQALAGKSWPGYKLVEGRSVRVISNPYGVAGALDALGYEREDYLNSKLKGLGDLEKLLTKKGFDEHLGKFVHKPPGRPALVDASDKRPALSNLDTAQKDFE